MPNVQEVLRQNEFNNLVSTEIIDAYINRLTGKRAVDINTIEELDSLNFFPMSYIASLNDDNKEKLLNVFKEAASSKDYRKFIQVVEARVPGINNRTNNGFAREYENFANLAGKSQINSVSFRDLMDSLNSGNSIFVRLRDRLRGIQNFRSMAGNRSDGFSGSQVARILSGLYYVNDEFVSKADDFVRFMEVRGLFTNRNEVTRHYNIEVMNNMGIYTNDIQNLIDSEEYREVAYNQNTNFNDYNIDDIQKISELDEKISSLVATPYIRNMLNLPEGQMVSRVDEDGIRRSEYVNHFKNLNNLNRTELVTLEELLKRNDNDNLQTITARLREYSSIINEVADKFYNEYSDKISKDIDGNPVIGRDNIKYRLVSALSREGAFAKSNVEDFIQVATNVCLKNDWIASINIEETAKNSIMTKKGNVNGQETSLTSCYVMVDNKMYELDNIEFARDKDNKLVFKNNLHFEEIKRRLTDLYGISFENVKKEDFTLGFNPLAENFMSTLVERQKQADASNSQVQDEDVSVENSENKQDDNKENDPQPMLFGGATGGNVFVGSDIYMKALIEARKRVREYILNGQVEVINKTPQETSSVEEKKAGKEHPFVKSSRTEVSFESKPEIKKLKNNDIIIKDDEHALKIYSNKKNDEEREGESPIKKAEEAEKVTIKPEVGSNENNEDRNSELFDAIRYKKGISDPFIRQVLADQQALNNQSRKTGTVPYDSEFAKRQETHERAGKENEGESSIKGAEETEGVAIKTGVEPNKTNEDSNSELSDDIRYKQGISDPFTNQVLADQQALNNQSSKTSIVPFDSEFAKRQEAYERASNKNAIPVLKETKKKVKPQKRGLYYCDELGRQIPVALKDGIFVVDKERQYVASNNRFYSVSPKKEKEFGKVLNNAQSNKNVVREYFDNQSKENKTVKEEENEFVK